MEEIFQQGKKLTTLKELEDFKMFAILSVEKSIVNHINGKIVMSMVGAPGRGDAMYSTVQAFALANKNPNDYIMGAQVIEGPFSTLLDLPVLFKSVEHPLFKSDAAGIKPVEEAPKEKSTQDMVAYVKFIFDTVGTEDEKRVCAAVIKKFEAHVNSVFGKK